MSQGIIGWAFAYRIEQDTLYIYDAENCRNLTTEYRNTEPFVLAQGISTNNKQCFSINYKVTACRKEDGYIPKIRNYHSIHD